MIEALPGEGSRILGAPVTSKRLFDAVMSAVGLAVTAPIFLFVAAAIKLSDAGPVFYRQVRIGLRGNPFRILKFRTMVVGADRVGPAVTKDGDTRITRVGRLLRKGKVDELPQLWNVLKGEMSFVGPRPEVPKYLERYTPDQRRILSLKPGITDLASVRFRHEEDILRHTTDVDQFYMQHCVPRKVELNLAYAARATLLSDIGVILRTVVPAHIGILCGFALLSLLSLAGAVVLGGKTPLNRFQASYLLVVIVQLMALAWQKQHRALISRFSSFDVRQITVALFAATIALGAIGSIFPDLLPPINVLVMHGLLAGAALVLARWFWAERPLLFGTTTEAGHPRRVAIVGAGETGARVAREVLSGKNRHAVVEAFFDDDSGTWQRLLMGIPVIGMPECLREGWAENLDEVIIALDRASPERVAQLRDLAVDAGLKYVIIPPLFADHG